MNKIQNFASVNTAHQITRNLYPNAQNIVIIEHSHDNIVALVDSSVAIRFPRDKNAGQRSIYEKHILNKLGSTGTIMTPRILQAHDNPPYLITSFVPGNHISAASIRKLPIIDQQNFARAIAQFAYTMHTSFMLDEEVSLRKELGLDKLIDNEPWPIYYKKVIYDKRYPTSIQDTLAKRCYKKWVQVCDMAPAVVVHDDLHSENMMFKDNRLVGILDFGDTSIGTPEQDLRQLYRISEEVMKTAAHEYQNLSGRLLNTDAIKTWAIMKELADYSKALAANNTAHHSFKRAATNLDIWLPEGNWCEGYELSSIKGFQ